ncbi:MAG TPA: class I SAM-dependent methyltransferase [Pyrinomonadaceae bacterium]|nr:class I SAM-dependent methyltransferase [Pyrinomonadaceae bacterium]
MTLYKISPHAHTIESRLIPGTVHYGIFHQLTGYVIEPRESVRGLLLAARMGNNISLDADDLDNLGGDGGQVRELIGQKFLIPSEADPFDSFPSLLEQFVVRPVQNPAIVYRDHSGETKLVRFSMAQRIYSPRRDELLPVVEETMPADAANVFLKADGSRTLGEIFASEGIANCLEDKSCRETIEYLTHPKRQLIKFTSDAEDLRDPYKPCNRVPRNFYHEAKWGQLTPDSAPPSIVDFHVEGIEDAAWEFDLIEPTVNHAFRFPSEALGGLNYGARFCLATLNPKVLPKLSEGNPLQVLEVGGGTGSFARSFIDQAMSLRTPAGGPVEINYQILDLSPSLIQSQQQKLAGVVPPVTHYQQDATSFNLVGRKFDLIIANEVIADFPVAWVRRARKGSNDSSHQWEGEGAVELERYDLDALANADAFLVNKGVFRFIEQAWQHLTPGGVVIMSEYGGVDTFPIQSYHLNHEEFSIHFGHVQTCARKVGFECRLIFLKDFLRLDDQLPMLDGQEEHIRCLNHVFQKHGSSLPFALISQNEFQKLFKELVDHISLTGVSFSPLANGFHYGPRINDFMVAIMTKPK